MAKPVSSSGTKKSGTVIKKCNCTHTFQEKIYGALYGPGSRVFNCTSSGGRTCTVCGTKYNS